MAQEYDVAILPWSPLQGGFLADKYTREQLENINEVDDDDRFKYDDYGWDIWKRLLTDDCWELLDTLREISNEKGCTVSQLTLAWIVQQKAVTSVIIGPRTRDHLMDNLGALDIELTADELQLIDSLSPPNVGLIQL